MNQPTGNLEDLFRHHLADAEAPVRPLLWEQIDNTLLIEQNALYRRRLTATRWLAAASLALASLAGGGWYTAQHRLAGAGFAVAPAPGNNRPAAAGSTTQNSQGSATASGGNGGGNGLLATAPGPATSAAGQPNDVTGPSGPSVGNGASTANGAISTLAASDATSPSYATASATAARTNKLGRQAINGIAAANPATPNRRNSIAATLAAVATTETAAPPLGLNQRRTPASGWLGARGWTLDNASTDAPTLAASGRYAVPAALGAATPAASAASASAFAMAPTSFPANFAAAGVAEEAAPGSLDLLATRPTALQLAARRGLPAGPATLPVAPAPVSAPLPKWAFGASYAVSSFQPNINFSRESSADYLYNMSPAVGPNSVALTEAAAAEYRDRLQAGTGQRLSLSAIRRLGKGRWNLASGLELAQNTARSASSTTFVGEQLPDLGQTIGNGAARATDFRYRTAGVPVELRYANPLKRGWSAYGRVGAVVSVLFNARATVDGVPEAARNYSLQSAGGTYRKVLTTVRGAAGVQFRPATGNCTYSLGPVAEGGLLSLNAHPNEDFLHQNRPYSLGVEAGVAFGR